MNFRGWVGILLHQKLSLLPAFYSFFNWKTYCQWYKRKGSCLVAHPPLHERDQTGRGFFPCIQFRRAFPKIVDRFGKLDWPLGLYKLFASYLFLRIRGAAGRLSRVSINVLCPFDHSNLLPPPIVHDPIPVEYSEYTLMTLGI